MYGKMLHGVIRASLCTINNTIHIIEGVSPRTSTYHLFQNPGVLNLQKLNLSLLSDKFIGSVLVI